MPKPLRMAVLIIAAAVGAFVLRQLYVAASTPAVSGAASDVNVRVAAADLPEGLLLRDNDLAWKRIPSAQVPAGAFVESQPGAELKGALLRNRVDAGTPIRADNVIPAGAPDFLAAALQPGMRAISVPVDDVSGNAGLIQPGDFVDVVLTQQIGGSATTPGTFEAETVVRRARVLAVGSEFQRAKAPASAPDAPVRARTVTLEVAPRTAQVVLVATRLGSLSLALRSFATSDRRDAAGGAEQEPDTPPVWAGDVSRAFRDAARSPSAKADTGARPAPQGNTVVIYRGSSVDDGSRGGGGGVGTPGLPPLPSGWPGTPVAPAAPAAGNAAADATAQVPRAAVAQ
ncbi:Flp pilus assembly protein CpaB [Burkholderia sp. BCCIQ04A]|uniref:Flp pilus assembly protein CpaB n=1 Tax=Burkholderia anthinoferrum TaxID=3090833 RepID=A0ABU5WL21_9BURK|nr:MULTISPECIES: Flp pilus assembly protein CpaB [Burkholderia]MEB2503296.1 Flp pilus assembly protein CpaB [Burkholderia anthinoferrum]MEB2529904.1 Flp pilus assembly protein CpaB [Burkholderia anthinoferrum]MEB2561714.1 Flp pilus assembly protein CpaB [Burkholderia anthinoferrum]MEB2579649.1 Flp pilus assembly protein CpaB [Burkholderia anthinoferrum]MDF3096896.1 Flp pilus assembly protein CpaB [Burkholderia semiarida]